MFAMFWGFQALKNKHNLCIWIARTVPLGKKMLLSINSQCFHSKSCSVNFLSFFCSFVEWIDCSLTIFYILFSSLVCTNDQSTFLCYTLQVFIDDHLYLTATLRPSYIYFGWVGWVSNSLRNKKEYFRSQKKNRQSVK